MERSIFVNATGVESETNRIGGGGAGGNTGPATSTSFPGGHSEREPPDPIPNSEVKTLCADGSVPFRHARVGHCQGPKENPRSREVPGVFALNFPLARMTPGALRGRPGDGIGLRGPGAAL